MRSKKSLSAYDEDKLNKIDRLKRRERGKSSGKKELKRGSREQQRFLETTKSGRKLQESQRNADRTKKLHALEGNSSDEEATDDGQPIQPGNYGSPGSIFAPGQIGFDRSATDTSSSSKKKTTSGKNSKSTLQFQNTLNDDLGTAATELNNSVLSSDIDRSLYDDLKTARAMSFEFMMSDSDHDNSAIHDQPDDSYGHIVSLPATPSPCRAPVPISPNYPNAGNNMTPTMDGRIMFPRMELIDMSESDESAASSPAKSLNATPTITKIFSPGSPFVTRDDMDQFSRLGTQPGAPSAGDSPFSPFQFNPSASSSVPASAAPLRRQLSASGAPMGHTPMGLMSRSRSTSTFEARSFTSPYLSRIGGSHSQLSQLSQLGQPPSFEEFQVAVSGGKTFSAVPSTESLPSQSPFKTVLPENVLTSPGRSSRKKTPLIRSRSAPTISDALQALSIAPANPSLDSISDENVGYIIAPSTPSPSNLPTPAEPGILSPGPQPFSVAAQTDNGMMAFMNDRRTSPMQALGPPVQPSRSHDAISAAIFSALFESDRPANRRRNWDSDSEDDSDEEGSLPRVRKVDEIWFKRLMTASLLSSTALDYAMKRVQFAQSNPSFSPPADDVLSQYISPCFISSITEQLAFEDDRFDSPRVSILKALYRHSRSINSPIRSMILRSLVEAIGCRQVRSADSMRIARQLDAEVNYIGSTGLLVDGLGGQTVVDAIRCAIDSKCGLRNQWGTGEERKGIKVRDNNGSIIELLNYLVKVELSECQQHPLALTETGSKGADKPDDDGRSQSHSLRYCWNRLILIQKSICLCLGSYGGALGLSSGGEFAEQPAQFNGIISCLENCFKVSALIPMSMVSSLGDYEDFLPLLNNPSLGLDSIRRNGHQRVSVELQSDNAEMKMVYAVATSLLKHWPDNDIVNGITGAGHVQMLAFLKAAELLVLSAGAYPIHLPRLLYHIKSKINGTDSSASIAVASIMRKQDVRQPSDLRLPAHQRDCIQNIFLKLFSCMSSSHFKVALQSLSLLNNPNILKKYFLERDSSFDKSCTLGDLKIMLAEQEKLSPTLKSNWNSIVDAALSAEVSSFRQDLLTRLVDSLRCNRAHWHPQVQTISDQLFDWLLDLE